MAIDTRLQRLANRANRVMLASNGIAPQYNAQRKSSADDPDRPRPLSLPDCIIFDTTSGSWRNNGGRRSHEPAPGTAYAEQTPATYRTLSDFLNSISTTDSLALAILDTRQIHYPGCEGAGLPIRTKQEITSDRSLSFDFFLVATLTE